MSGVTMTSELGDHASPRPHLDKKPRIGGQRVGTTVEHDQEHVPGVDRDAAGGDDHFRHAVRDPSADLLKPTGGRT
jgi:hypothetical protein